MKYLITTCILIFSLLLFGINVHGQDFFEGSLTYKVEIKGPMSEMLNKNEPNHTMTMHVREADYIILLSGGRYPKTFLFMADSNREYSIDMAKKMAFKFSTHGDQARASHEEEQKRPVSAKATGNQLEIQGVMCEEYKLKKGAALFSYYVNDEYRVNLDLVPKRPRTKASFLVKGLEGRIPLKTIKREKDLLVVTTAVKISPKEFDPSQFDIPPGFKVKGRDYRY